MTASYLPDKPNRVDFLKAWFAAAGDRAYRQRWLVLLTCLAILGTSVFLASGVRFNNSFNAYFDEHDPTYTGFLDFRDQFGSDEISYILYTAPTFEHSVWNVEVMRKIRDLTRRLENEVPFAKEAVSLTSAEFLEGVEGELLVYEIAEKFPETQAELLQLKERVLSKPVYVDGLADRSGQFGAIILEMEKASVDPVEEIRYDPAGGDNINNLYPQVTHDRVESILALPEYADIEFYHTGDVPLNAAYNRTIQSESLRLAVISFAVIGLLLLLFFRTAMGVIGPLLIVFCSLAVAIGFVGLFAWDFDLMFIVLPPLLIAVGVADAVHILSEYNHCLENDGDRKKAIRQTLYLVGVPCLFTSLTTMAGFAAMSISPIKAMEHFAIYSAIGVGAAFLLSVSLLVAVLSFGRRHPFDRTNKQPGKIANDLLLRLLVRIGRINIRHRDIILIVSAGLLLFSAAGMSRLKVDSNFLTEFSPRTEIRRVTEFVDTVMGGTIGFSYIFDSGRPDGVTDPVFLRQIEFMQQAAEQQELVKKAYSIVDIIKDINREFNNGDLEHYRLPETQELAAQLLLIYEMSGGEELSDYLTGDFQRARLELRCQSVESSRYKSMVDELSRLFRAGTQADLFPEPELSGMGVLWLKLLDYIAGSQIRGFSLAFVVIAAMMCLVLGSWRVGLLVMIPNLAPIVITLGLMGWFGIALDYVKLLIGCIAIGIAVDDTVHMITRYQHEFRTHGNYQQALLASFRGVGRALFITSAVLVAGFMVPVFSIMQTLVEFGLLVSFSLFMALLADFFLLPALVLRFKPFGPERSPDTS